MYFQRNYRQKFAAYLMVKYKYEYTVNQWGSGLGGWDRNWSYTFKEILVTNKYLYLVPIEPHIIQFQDILMVLRV